MRVLSLIILLSTLSVFGQNLIPNPGFEETTGCPSASAFLKNTVAWYNLPNHNGTADQYYGDCPYNGIKNPMAPDQLPFEGDGYAGGFCFYGQYDQGEYLCVELNETMVRDSLYYIEFYVLPSPRYPNFIDSYGAHFSSDPPQGNGNGLKTQNQFEEHIGNPRGQLIKDTINWTKISGTYKAKGGEKYMTLGNFRSTSQTMYESYERGNYVNINSAYFFVDGIGVKLYDGQPFVWDVNKQPNIDALVYDITVPPPPEDTTVMQINEEREIKIAADFITDLSKVKISVWDHRIIDKDTVNIIFEEKYLAENLPIKRNKKRYKLELEPGEYIFGIEAISLGEIPPCTVAVKITDGKQTKLFILNSDLSKTEALRIIIR